MPFVLQLADNQDCTFLITGEVDKKGNPAPIGGPVVFSSSDSTTVTATADATNPNQLNMSAVGPLSAAGTSVTISMDSTDATPVHDVIAVTVVSSAPTGFAGTLGTPTNQP
jgi:hypothetical protein